MQNFKEYVLSQKLEPLKLELALTMAYCKVDPEDWIVKWVKKQAPLSEDIVLNSFNKMILEQDNPFAGHGGFLGGAKNWLKSLWGGAKQGWKSATDTITDMSYQQTENAFANAYKYLHTLVNTIQQDSRLRNQIGDVGQVLSRMLTDLSGVGNQLKSALSGEVIDAEAVPEREVQPEAEPQSPQPESQARPQVRPMRPFQSQSLARRRRQRQKPQPQDRGDAPDWRGSSEDAMMPNWGSSSADTGVVHQPSRGVTSTGLGFGRKHKSPYHTQHYA